MLNISLNLDYLGPLADNGQLLSFIVSSRVRRIQAAYREHFELKVFAANFIRKQWKVYQRSKDARGIKRAAVAHMRKQVAINRIYEFSKLIKVRKVTAAQQLLLDSIVSGLTELRSKDGFLAKIVKIQKFWKAKLAKRYLLGHRI